MIIRQAQMDELKKARLRAFEDEMVPHLAAFSPPLFNTLQEPQMRLVIQHGIVRAGEHGLTFRGPVRLYLELMLLFGSAFDTDPQYEWATTILQDRDSAPQMERADRLYEKTLEYRAKVGGPNDTFTLQALRRLHQLASQEVPIAASDVTGSVLEQMEQVYPEKTAYVGEEALKLLINRGEEVAHGYGFAKARAVALPPVLMFAFGHGCIDDPLYPWIGRTLKRDTIMSPDARARRLEKKAVIWLEHVLSYFAAAS